MQLTECGKDSEIKEFEICAVALEVARAKKAQELVKALEMEEFAESVAGNTKHLLECWQEEMFRMGIPARQHLMIQMRKIGLKDLYVK